MPTTRLDVFVGASSDCDPERTPPETSNTVEQVAPGRVREPAEPSSIDRFLQPGLIAGVIGYAVAAVFFAVASVLGRHSTFDVATVLRGSLFLGPQNGPGTMTVTGPVFTYNGPRLVTFLMAGVVIALLASVVERAPRVMLVASMLLVFVAAPAVGLPAVIAKPVVAEFSPWLVTVATSLSALAMTAYLWKAYSAAPQAGDRRASR